MASLQDMRGAISDGVQIDDDNSKPRRRRGAELRGNQSRSPPEE